jgi:hypothetical protein
MGALFGQAIAAFQGFFSRGFWFGAFLPVAIIGALNVLLAWFTFDGTQGLVDHLVADKWTWGAPIFATLIVAAYALAPLVPLCRAVLDGRQLPEAVFERLRRRPLAEFRRAYGDWFAAVRAEQDLIKVRNAAEASLLEAREAGTAVGQVAQIKLIADARKALVALELRRDRGRVLPRPELEDGWKKIKEALEKNDPSQDNDLNSFNSRMLAILDLAVTEAGARTRRQQDRTKRLPPDARDVQPTASGNARSLSELYSQRVYNVEFGFLWSRVQMVIPENDVASKRIEAARSLVDFAVLSLVLGTASIAVWLPILAWRDTTPWPFLLLAILGPLFVRFCYQLVVESQNSLGEVAQGIVDKYRFDVLKMLNIRPPVTLSEERRIWSSLSAVARDDPEARNTDFVWAKPP